ncbi:MAG: M64 family metallopeptidase [Nanoarchaeota archaeon]|nr:M64 family metallopeptidase [Nanoarchaeota archaeon]MBU0977058.1 M64 family metallopeptidase [Nanoarchaeota archaeon]
MKKVGWYIFIVLVLALAGWFVFVEENAFYSPDVHPRMTVEPVLSNILSQIYPEESCQWLWWYDSYNLYCRYGEFCGAFMYPGLRTFPTEQECMNDLFSSYDVCLDTDNGIDLHKKGVVEEDTIMKGQDLTDVCWNYDPESYGACEGDTSGCVLTEYSCKDSWDENYGWAAKETYECGVGSACYDGACVCDSGRGCSIDFDCFTGEVCNDGCCVRMFCQDTDSGRDPLVYGSTFGYIQSEEPENYFDYCIENNLLKEFYCDRNKIVSENVNCEQGTCINGAGCIETCQADGIMNNYETDIDCGGRNCPDCENGKTCKVSTDCLSGYCTWDGVCEDFPEGFSSTCTPIKYDGDINNHVNIVIVGGQYDYQTEFQIDNTLGFDKYVEDVYAITKDFLNIAPYADFDKINVFRVNDISATENWGISHTCVSSTNWDCTEINLHNGCDSPFSPYWHERACRRVNYKNANPVSTRLNQCPTYGTNFPVGTRFALIVVNDDYYGGVRSSDLRAVATRHVESVDIARHELLGHAIGDLLDEYVTKTTYYQADQPEELNCDITQSCIRWEDLIAANVEEVGCFAGCALYPGGISRGTETSLMRELGYPFYKVNERAICCKFIDLTGDISPSCQFFETTGTNLYEYCTSSPTRGAERVTEFFVEKGASGGYEVEDIRTQLWRNIDDFPSTDIAATAFDKEGTVLRTAVAPAVISSPFMPTSSKEEGYHVYTEIPNAYVVYVAEEIENIKELKLNKKGKSYFIDVG